MKKMTPRNIEQNQKMRADAKTKLVDAALHEFVEFGYNGTTMKQITERAGLSYGLLYHYFSSKEEIFRSLVEQALEKSIDTIKEGLAKSGTAWEKLTNLSAILIERVLTPDSSPYFLIMIQAFTQGKKIPGLIEFISKSSQIHYETLLPVIIEAQQSGDALKCDPIALTATYLSLIQGLSFLVFGESGLEKKITPEIFLNLLRQKGEYIK